MFASAARRRTKRHRQRLRQRVAQRQTAEEVASDLVTINCRNHAKQSHSMRPWSPKAVGRRCLPLKVCASASPVVPPLRERLSIVRRAKKRQGCKTLTTLLGIRDRLGPPPAGVVQFREDIYNRDGVSQGRPIPKVSWYPHHILHKYRIVPQSLGRCRPIWYFASTLSTAI